MRIEIFVYFIETFFFYIYFCFTKAIIWQSGKAINSKITIQVMSGVNFNLLCAFDSTVVMCHRQNTILTFCQL